MSCFEYGFMYFFCHHRYLYLPYATQFHHGLLTTREVNCFDIVDRIMIIPNY